MNTTSLTITGPMRARYDEILTPDALAFVERLQHRFGGHARQLAQRGATAQGGAHAGGAGAGVGVTGVDHQVTGLRRRQILAGHLHRRGAERIGGEDRSGFRAVSQFEHHQIAAVPVTDIGFGNTNAHAVDRVHDGKGQIADGHDDSLLGLDGRRPPPVSRRWPVTGLRLRGQAIWP